MMKSEVRGRDDEESRSSNKIRRWETLSLDLF